MKIASLLFAVLLLLPGMELTAQISPGDLARAHAQLEGISNCTQCHVLGAKVSNDKCLACHDEIQSLIQSKAGYHASRDVRGKECASCHSDHHGRNFDMTRFDEASFNHRLTGYELTGAHQTTDCRDCHKPDNINDRELKARNGTWLGLETRCIDCHDDGHQPSLGNDCAKCHETNDFSPAPKFDHAKTDFPLVGQHLTVACKECHTTETRQGKQVPKFSNIAFANCNSCHDDPHSGQLGTSCNQCHTEQSFTSTAGLNHFNHNQTGFPLKGRHRRVDCFSCHQANLPASRVFQDKAFVPTNDCAACHADVHDGKLGAACADCHTEEGFRGRMDPGKFDHNRTSFALEGKHQAVDCRKCHKSDRMTDPLPHNTCAACHQDYHQSDFATAGRSPDCVACHAVTGFSPSLFTLEDHAKTAFPLDGGHLATPCFACHLAGDQWRFKDIGNRCVDCHEDVHQGEINTKYYPLQACENCHVTTTWLGDHKFDHNKTNFALLGEHLNTACVACHQQDAEKPHGKFAGLAHECTACHENIHGNQFEKAGQTDCTRCHSFAAGWEATYFNHNLTPFPLTGKHAEVACSACHLETVVQGVATVTYKLERFECRDCHQ